MSEIHNLIQQLRGSYNESQEAISLLVQMGNSAVPELHIAIMELPYGLSYGFAERVIDALRLINTPDALQAIAEWRDSRLSVLRSDLADQNIGSTWFLDEMVDLFGADVLDQIGMRDTAVSILVEATTHYVATWNGRAATYTIGTLGIVGDGKVVPYVLSLLDDDDTDVIREAVTALGNLREPSAVPALVQLLNNPEYWRQAELRYYRRHQEGSPTWDMEETIWRRQFEITLSLEKIGTPEALTAVKAWRAKQNRE